MATRDSLDRYGVGDLRGRDPRDLRAAALLIEAEALAAEVRRLAGGADVDTEVCLSVDHETAFVGDLDAGEAARLRDTLRGLPGAAGVERFFGRRAVTP